jgi:hypothetical protein
MVITNLENLFRNTDTSVWQRTGSRIPIRIGYCADAPRKHIHAVSTYPELNGSKTKNSIRFGPSSIRPSPSNRLTHWCPTIPSRATPALHHVHCQRSRRPFCLLSGRLNHVPHAPPVAGDQPLPRWRRAAAPVMATRSPCDTVSRQLHPVSCLLQQLGTPRRRQGDAPGHLQWNSPACPPPATELHPPGCLQWAPTTWWFLSFHCPVPQSKSLNQSCLPAIGPYSCSLARHCKTG